MHISALSNTIDQPSSAESTFLENASFKNTLLKNTLLLGFGLAIIFAVGFIPTEAAHNAAHDTRHALAFPCH